MAKHMSKSQSSLDTGASLIRPGTFTQCKKAAQSANWLLLKKYEKLSKKKRTGKGEGHSPAVQQQPLLAKEKSPNITFALQK